MLFFCTLNGLVEVFFWLLIQVVVGGCLILFYLCQWRLLRLTSFLTSAPWGIVGVSPINKRNVPVKGCFHQLPQGNPTIIHIFTLEKCIKISDIQQGPNCLRFRLQCCWAQDRGYCHVHVCLKDRTTFSVCRAVINIHMRKIKVANKKGFLRTIFEQFCKLTGIFCRVVGRSIGKSNV